VSSLSSHQYACPLRLPCFLACSIPCGATSGPHLVSPPPWSEYISNNYRQTFRFALPPGQYVLEGRYACGNGISSWPISVTAGKSSTRTCPNECK
jgi:hypothetical protein